MSDTRLTIAVALALCLCTCAIPLFNVSPAALGKMEWSTLDIWRLSLAGDGLPMSVSRLWGVHFRLWGVYVLLATALLLLWLPLYVKPVAICTFLALLWILRSLGSHYDFWLMLKKQTGWHDGTISVNPEVLVLPALLMFVLFILSFEWNRHSEA
jgi:hypothetical protein